MTNKGQQPLPKIKSKKSSKSVLAVAEKSFAKEEPKKLQHITTSRASASPARTRRLPSRKPMNERTTKLLTDATTINTSLVATTDSSTPRKVLDDKELEIADIEKEKRKTELQTIGEKSVMRVFLDNNGISFKTVAIRSTDSMFDVVDTMTKKIFTDCCGYGMWEVRDKTDVQLLHPDDIVGEVMAEWKGDKQMKLVFKKALGVNAKHYLRAAPSKQDSTTVRKAPTPGIAIISTSTKVGNRSKSTGPPTISKSLPNHSPATVEFSEDSIDLTTTQKPNVPMPEQGDIQKRSSAPQASPGNGPQSRTSRRIAPTLSSSKLKENTPEKIPKAHLDKGEVGNTPPLRGERNASPLRGRGNFPRGERGNRSRGRGIRGVNGRGTRGNRGAPRGNMRGQPSGPRQAFSSPTQSQRNPPAPLQLPPEPVSPPKSAKKAPEPAPKPAKQAPEPAPKPAKQAPEPAPKPAKQAPEPAPKPVKQVPEPNPEPTHTPEPAAALVEPVGKVESASYLSKHITEWTIEEVGQWVVDLGFKPVKKNFVDNYISGFELVELTNEELKVDLGVAALGARKAILRKIVTLNK